MLPRMLIGLCLITIPLAGCIDDTSSLALQMGWDGADHAWMTVTNEGDRHADMNEIMQRMQMTGPYGHVPMYWGGLDGDSQGCWMGDDAGGMGHGHMGQGHCGSGTWGGMQMHHGGSQLGPGETWTYHMHALDQDGTWGMMVMPAPQDGNWKHMHGDDQHRTMEPGDYTCQLGRAQTDATLES